MSYRDYKKQLERRKEEARTLNTIEKNISTFNSRKKEYVEEAKEALRRGDNMAYKTASMMLKNIIFQLAQANDMLANFKAARDMREMGSLNVTFTRAMDKVITTLNKSNKQANFKKTRDGFAKAMYNQGDAAQQLKDLLSSNGMAFADTVQSVTDITDDEVKRTLEEDIKNEYREADTLLDSLEDAFGDKNKQTDGEKGEMVAVTNGSGDTAHPVKNTKNNKADDSAKNNGAVTPATTDTAPVNNDVKGGANNNCSNDTANNTSNNASNNSNGNNANNNSNNGNANNGKAPNKNSGKNDDNDKDVSPENAILEGGLGKESEEFKFNWDSLPATTFDDVAGLEEVKETVKIEVLMPLKHPEAFEGYEIKKGGGLLLYGPPGTGKTMIAAAIANEIGAKFCAVKPSDLLHQGVGQSEKAIKALFAQARQFPCAIIYFDEMDSISPKNTRSQYSKNLRSELLAQIQGMESYKKDDGKILYLIAATNKPWDIDSAFIRPGRFGTRVYVGLPDEDARRYIIEHRFEKLKESGKVTLYDDLSADILVEKTKGFNGSDITNLLDKAEKNSVQRNVNDKTDKYLCMADFDEALTKVTSSVQREDIEKLINWKGQNA